MEETSEHERTEAHRKVVEPLWTEPVVDALGDRLPLEEGGSLLVAEARCGYVPIELRSLASGRIIALDDQRPMLDAARERAEASEADDIFFVAEEADSISYADGVFDLTLCLHDMITPDRVHRVLEELTRVTVEGGRVAVAVPLSSSLPAFYDLLDEAMRRHDLDDRLDDIAAMRRDLIAPEHLVDVADRLSLEVETLDQLSWDVEFDWGRGFLNSPLVRETFFSHWMRHVPSADRESLLESIGDAIDTYWQDEPFRTRIDAGLLISTTPS